VGLTAGVNNLVLRATDLAGNTQTTSLSVTLDQSIANPTGGLTAATDSGVVGDNQTTFTQVNITGIGEAGSTVTIVGTSFSTTADNAGSFTFTGIQLVAGANVFLLEAEDAAGNVSSANVVVRLDQSIIAPTAQLADASDSGTKGDGITNINPVSIVGTAEAQSTITIDGRQGSVVANAQGQYTLTGVTLSAGVNSLVIRSTDGAGNTQTTNLSVTLDQAITTLTAQLDRANDSGTVGDNATNAATVTITGTAEGLSTITIDGTAISVQANAQGQYTLSNVPLAQGSNPFVIRSTDSVGNTTTAGLSLTRQNLAPTLSKPLVDINSAVSSNNRTAVVELADFFKDADINNSLVRINTDLGAIDVELLDLTAPMTVANFLNYVEEGDYVDTIIHRSDDDFVIQGGGFRLTGAAPTASLTQIPVDPAVRNEFGASNVRGTIAMARVGGQVNSATSQWFINTGNNTGLNNVDQGFTVFGNVVNGTMAVVDQINDLPVQARSSPFNEIPLLNFPTPPNGVFPGNLTRDNTIETNVVVLRRVEELTYTIDVQSANANLITILTQNNRLTYRVNANQTGTATVTVTATDRAGAQVSDVFTVTIT
jgi:cyclophilin family peptidyl-prolyl cis-trans isomerase